MATPDPVDPATLEIKTRSIEQTLLPLVKQVRRVSAWKCGNPRVFVRTGGAPSLSHLSLSACIPLFLSVPLFLSLLPPSLPYRAQIILLSLSPWTPSISRSFSVFVSLVRRFAFAYPASPSFVVPIRWRVEIISRYFFEIILESFYLAAIITHAKLYAVRRAHCRIEREYEILSACMPCMCIRRTRATAPGKSGCTAPHQPHDEERETTTWVRYACTTMREREREIGQVNWVEKVKSREQFKPVI